MNKGQNLGTIIGKQKLMNFGGKQMLFSSKKIEALFMYHREVKMLFSLFHSHNNHDKVGVLKYRFVSTTISNTLFFIFIHFVLGKKSHEIHTISFHN